MDSGIARVIAKAAHQGQKYGDNDYFSYHVCGVVAAVKHLGDDHIQAAYLHDVVEDTLITIDDLVSASFSEVVVNSVCLLTHNIGIEYLTYLERIKVSRIATDVKRADILFNLSNSEIGSKRHSRYTNAIRFMSN